MENTFNPLSTVYALMMHHFTSQKTQTIVLKLRVFIRKIAMKIYLIFH